MSQTITETVTVDPVVSEQFLSANLEEMNRLNDLAKKENYKPQIVWRNVALFIALHFGALIGFYQFCFTAKWLTSIWGKCLDLLLKIN
jgi:stearoyl-CoA desaturase (delta-9 desaturase)